MLARALLPGCRLSRRNTYRHICSTSRWRCDVKSSTLHTQREGKVLQTAAPYHSGRPIGVKLTKSPSMSVGARVVRSGGGGAVLAPPPPLPFSSQRGEHARPPPPRPHQQPPPPPHPTLPPPHHQRSHSPSSPP